jgi:tRNA threonylcarbamoyladenosine biosynthesis protein TsaE
MKQEITIKDIEDLERAAQEFLEKIGENTLVALFAPMGSGKTTFTTAICRVLGVTDPVGSPTFAIVNEYSGKYNIYHFDMYRITSDDDLYSTGFYDYLDTGVIVIEWSENIEYALDENAIRIRIEKSDDENVRIFTIEGLDEYEDIIT